MSQAENEGFQDIIEVTQKWLYSNVAEPEKTTLSHACFVMQGGILIMGAQFAIEQTLHVSVCYSDLVCDFLEKLKEASQKL